MSGEIGGGVAGRVLKDLSGVQAVILGWPLVKLVLKTTDGIEPHEPWAVKRTDGDVTPFGVGQQLAVAECSVPMLWMLVMLTAFWLGAPGWVPGLAAAACAGSAFGVGRTEVAHHRGVHVHGKWHT